MCPGTSPGLEALTDVAGARGSRATCVYVSWLVELYNSGNASRGLLAGHGAGTMNHSPWVGHCREVGPGPGGARPHWHCMHTTMTLRMMTWTNLNQRHTDTATHAVPRAVMRTVRMQRGLLCEESLAA